jgi:hypothetical protein
LKKIFPITFIIILTVSFSGNLAAQNNAVLRVVTLNAEDGIPFSGATVTLSEPGSDETPGFYCVSDRNGFQPPLYA